MTNDMTTGNPVKLIIYFMIPTCLGNIFQQFYNLADSIVAGRFIGVNALAPIGSTSSLIFLVIGWLNGLTSGFSILVAQHFGAKKYDRMRHYIAMSIFLCILFVVVMTAALESSMGRPCILPDTSQQSSMLAELYSTFSRLYSEI